MRWELGRQLTGYKKLKLFEFSWPWKMDCYLLRYDVGDEIPWHTDPVPGHQHWRLNIALGMPKVGGYLLVQRDDGRVWTADRIVLFRSDIRKHMVTSVVEGQRLVLTFGWLRRESHGRP